jgi:hypothetical protein
MVVRGRGLVESVKKENVEDQNSEKENIEMQHIENKFFSDSEITEKDFIQMCRKRRSSIETTKTYLSSFVIL